MRWGLGLFGLASVLCGCSSTGSLTGAVAGAAAGGGSVNPALGYAVGIGTKATTDALVQYITRARHRGEQDKLAQAAGDLLLGSTTSWAIKHRIPLFDDAHGRVTAVREIVTPLAPCRELIFSILTGKRERPAGRFTTAVCRDATGWRWAQAEPSTDRWGFLQ